MKKFLITILAAGSLGLNMNAYAAERPAVPSHDWSFKGIFGTFDRAAMQRGFQVYKEICAACHSLRLLYFRNLADLGYNKDEIKAFAAEYTVMDGPDEMGEMYERPGKPTDHFVPPFPNENAARAANNGAYPPDLSLITKARHGYEDYIYALMIGYEEEAPAGIEMMEGMSYNKYFPGHQIAMMPSLVEDGVEYADGTPATIEQMASDVVTFLAWAAEPTMEERKRIGLKVMFFLIVLTVLLAVVKRKVWEDVH